MSRRSLVSITLLMVALSLAIAPARAAVSVWSALVLATNEKNPTEPTGPLGKIEDSLENVFGYNQFTIIGQTTRVIDDPAEHWLIPGRKFSVRVALKKSEHTGFLLRLHLFQEKKFLLETQARLALHSPLIIRGPLYGHGQLLLIFMVK